jgi:urease accessory protein
VILVPPCPGFLSQEKEEELPASLSGDGSGLRGHLELICAVDVAGRSYLSRQSFNAPFHLSKPYWDGSILSVQVVNPTAGLLAGDSLRCCLKVETGARLRVTTPSATRVFTMSEASAQMDQDLRVAHGARLAFLPSMLVPHRGSCYRQKTRLEVERGGELFYLDTIAPGRVAHGESFAFARIDFETDLFFDGRLNARERFRLRPDDASLWSLRALYPQAFWASGYLVTDRLTDEHPALDRIRHLHGAGVWVGLSRLSLAGWSIKIVAPESWSMSQTLASLRRILAEALPAFVLPKDR